MNDQTRRKWQPLRAWVNNNQAIHTGIGLVGNASFFIGSVFFFWDTLKVAGVCLFVLGSLFMLVGSAGDTIVKYETRRHMSSDMNF